MKNNLKQKDVGGESGISEIRKKSTEKRWKNTTNERMMSFLIKATNKHNRKYDYSKSDYIKSCIKIEIKCPDHGSFWITPNNHLSGKGCMKCKSEKMSKERSMGKLGFIEKSRNIFGDKYDYSEVLYFNNRTKVKIKCKKHGYFWQVAGTHLSGHGCPICNFSKGEQKIRNFLNRNNISFIPEWSSSDCKNPKTKRKLEFDFYIPSKNLLIEFDGQQHFKCGITRNFFVSNETLNYTKYKDEIKNQYAKNSSIKLLRIKYTSFDAIEKILEKEMLC